MPVTRWTLTGSDGQLIFGDSHVPAEAEPKAVLVMCHGFKGYKDYGFMPYVAQRAADAGFIAHRFNFSHSGMTNNIATFERPDLFERDTWNKQMYDLRTVSRAIVHGELPGQGLPQVWFGHSRGGVTVVLTAARIADEKADHALAGIILAATPDDSCRFGREQRELMKKFGYLDSLSTRTGQNLRIGLPWLEEIEANPDAFDPRQAIVRVKCPILVIHGENDPTVPPEAARTLAKAAGHNAQLEILPGASHVFNCPNPLKERTPPEATVHLADAVNSFIAGLIA